MVEHNDDFNPTEDFNPSEPAPEPVPEGGFGDLSFDAEKSETEPGRPAPLTDAGFREEISTRPKPAPVSSAVDAGAGRGRSAFPSLLAAATVLGLLGAWAYVAKPWEPRAKATRQEVAGSTSREAKPSPSVAEVSKGVESLQSEVEGLRDDLKTLQERVDAIPKPTPPPDLGPINEKIADLASKSEPVADLPKKLNDLDGHVGAIDKSITDLQGALDALKGEIKKAGESTTPATETSTSTSTPAPTEDVNVSDAAMNQAVDLFKAGKYKEANDAFLKLTESHPDDARVWYYAALSRGSATKDWAGETTRMVEKGVEREKAGTPETSRIDAVFANLNPSFKPWLDAYRKGAKPR